MDTSKSASLSLSHSIAYAAPSLTTAWLMTPVAIVQGIYAKYYGLSLTLIATIVLVARLVDAVSDPLIGYWSDRYYQRRGSRKPFILMGGLLFIVCAYFLYVPPANVGAWYFTGWFIAFYLAWTLFEVPHITWASELAANAKDKTKIYSTRMMAGYAGLLCFYMVPLLPIFDSHAITPETLRVSVMIAGLLMLPLLMFGLKVTPNHHGKQNIKPACKDQNHLISTDIEARQALLPLSDTLLKNRPFLLLISAYALVNIGASMWYGLAFIFVDIYLGMGEQFAQMFMLAFAIGVLVTPVWYKIAIHLGKKNTWLASIFLFVFCYLFTGTLTPGDTSFIELLVLKGVQTIGFVCMGVMSQSMLAEICDYGIWKFKREQSATYFSVYTFATKATGAIATAIGLALAGWYGFDATAATQTESGVRGLILAMTWIPLVFTGLAVVCVFLSPIDTRRHAIIQRRLEATFHSAG